jgi:hypothetical protein
MGFVVLEGVIALAQNPLKRNSAYVAIACACMLLVATAMTTIMPVTESALRMSASKAAAITHVRHTAVVVYAIYGALVPIAQVRTQLRARARARSAPPTSWAAWQR